jgi:hypothetical protein
MAALDVTQKAEIYERLAALNKEFLAIVQHLRALQQTGLFKSKYAQSALLRLPGQTLAPKPLRRPLRWHPLVFRPSFLRAWLRYYHARFLDLRRRLPAFLWFRPAQIFFPLLPGDCASSPKLRRAVLWTSK